MSESKLLNHVRVQIAEAREHLDHADRLLADPYPGFVTWMQFLGEDLTRARKAIDEALIAP